jgi:hypothetical protein
MPLILPGNVATATADTGYNVANSCRFNDGDSPDIRRTFGSAGDLDKWTFSCWYKRSSQGSATQRLFGAGSNNTTIYFSSSDQLAFYDAALDTGWDVQNTDHRKFRDISAWYHIVWTLDSAQGTAANRVKCYVNGVQQTLTKSGSGGDQNFTTAINTAAAHFISKRPTHSTGYLDGYLAEVCFNDGQAYAASNYGEYDEDSPQIWKPKDVSGLTFGTNGFYLDFEDSGTLGNDANGGTDWTATNLAAADQATDTPTNNFCTLNPLEAVTATTTYAEGNTQGTTSNAARATFAVSNGKWYWEHKFVNKEAMGGVMAYNGFLPNAYTINALIQGSNPELVLNGTEQSSWSGDGTPDAMVDNDILNVALDCDNNRIAFGVNGAYLNATDGSGEWSGTTLNYYSISDGYDYAPAFRTGSGTNRESHFNFGGCPGFAISSGNADANGYGNFEYAVPSGFFALCTKNLAEYG